MSDDKSKTILGMGALSDAPEPLPFDEDGWDLPDATPLRERGEPADQAETETAEDGGKHQPFRTQPRPIAESSSTPLPAFPAVRDEGSSDHAPDTPGHAASSLEEEGTVEPYAADVASRRFEDEGTLNVAPGKSGRYATPGLSSYRSDLKTPIIAGPIVAAHSPTPDRPMEALRAHQSRSRWPAVLLVLLAIGLAAAYVLVTR